MHFIPDPDDGDGRRRRKTYTVFRLLASDKNIQWNCHSPWHCDYDCLTNHWRTTHDIREYRRAPARDPLGRQFARMALAGLPRGGGDGDAIRLGILNVMRENGIREGHRPVRTSGALHNWPHWSLSVSCKALSGSKVRRYPQCHARKRHDCHRPVRTSPGDAGSPCPQQLLVVMRKKSICEGHRMLQPCIFTLQVFFECSLWLSLALSLREFGACKEYKCGWYLQC